ncbi:uncharacterized protein BO87DRAFT_220416 [Aspergillus neoniger CBS 115656]|uniref:Uncharacterized protein n=1 Tax=Aspergillus neoniger (strain CBS 115656) TaxID=1448310 RepID=A0A318YQX5_ASPNB|nr:hypothetical protein BO87DRAFT_220416 [Aspergillus neoniger CBS 115656]PYH37065.1 hypothetical protein BO87DRAFT_220416 [Aspergillus neoniger CBS 115656]
MPIKPNPSNATTPTAISNLSFCPTPRARPTQPSPSQSLLDTGSGERAISQPCDGPGNPIHPALNPTRSPFFSPSLPFPFLFFSFLAIKSSRILACSSYLQTSPGFCPKFFSVHPVDWFSTDPPLFSYRVSVSPHKHRPPLPLVAYSDTTLGLR